MNEFFDASTNNHRKREIGEYFIHSVITYEWDWTINFNFENLSCYLHMKFYIFAALFV